MTIHSLAGIDECIEDLKRCKHISEPNVRMLCHQAKEIIVGDDNVLWLSSPISLCGDVRILKYSS